METVLTQATPIPSAQRWASRILFGIATLFMTFDCVVKLARATPAIESTTELGWAPGAVFAIGLVEMVCLIAYVIPRTAILGAILLTGYLGGAIATHARLGNPLFTHTLFPVYVAALIWGALYLRDARLRALVPFTAKG